MEVQHSDLEIPPVDTSAGDQEAEFVPAETRTNQVETTVRLRDGTAMLIGGGAVSSPNEKSQTLVFVSAQVAE